MAKILKYKVVGDKSISPVPHIKTPPNSTVLSVAMMPDGIAVWCMCPSPDLPCSEVHHLLLVKTGQELPDWLADCRHLATIQYTSLKKLTTAGPNISVEHVFEIDHKQAAAFKS